MNEASELVSGQSIGQRAAAVDTGQVRRRVILLGASNLTRSFPTVVATARRTWNEPVEIMAAMGHGRSFGQDSSVLGRKISGIFPCALWQDLRRRPKLPVAALVTDIGNDLLYGVPPDRLIEWVERCLDELVRVEAATVITQMPIGSVAELGERRFRFFRNLFFPRSRMTLPEAKELVLEFNERLIHLGESRKIPVIPVPARWYGFDPIHLRRREFRNAWPELLASWSGGPEPVIVARQSIWTAAYLSTLAPSERSILGIRRRAIQPSGRMADGTTISLY